MAELTDQERADLEGLMRVNFGGGKLSYYILMHYSMGRVLGEIDRILNSQRKAIGQAGASDEHVSTLVETVQRVKDARQSFTWLCICMDNLLSHVTGVPNEEVVRIVGELSGKHHPPDCGCGMHEAQTLEVSDAR